MVWGASGVIGASLMATKFLRRIRVRRVALNEATIVSELNRRVWGSDKNIHSLLEIRNRLKNPNYACFGAFLGRKLVGFTFLDTDFKSNKIRLLHITVDREYQGKGIASLIFEAVERYCAGNKKTGIFMFLNKDNLESISWAKKAGFVKAGQSKWLYRGNRTAHIYYRQL